MKLFLTQKIEITCNTLLIFGILYYLYVVIKVLGCTSFSSCWANICSWSSAYLLGMLYIPLIFLMQAIVNTFIYYFNRKVTKIEYVLYGVVVFLTLISLVISKILYVFTFLFLASLMLIYRSYNNYYQNK